MEGRAGARRLINTLLTGASICKEARVGGQGRDGPTGSLRSRWDHDHPVRTSARYQPKSSVSTKRSIDDDLSLP